MPKKLIQDIITSKKTRSTNVRFSSSPKIKKEKTPEPIQEKIEPVRQPIKKILTTENYEEEIHNDEPEKISKNSQVFLWIISAISLAGLIFLASSFFSTASITITPKSKIISLDDTYQTSAKTEFNCLHFQVMTINKTASKNLDTDGESYVEKKASGQAVVYNNYSQIKQRLINNTRLQSTDGLIYRIQQSVDIPGYKIINGTKVPGSIVVGIVADVAGDKYNMKVSDLKGDFKIPGFQGSTKYSLFYGRLSADLTGGFTGNMKKVSDEKLTASRNEMKDSLKTEILKEMYEQKPQQFLILKDNYYINYTDGDNSQTNDAQYTITETATVNAIMFDESALAQTFAKDKIKDFNNKEVDILAPENILSTILSSSTVPWTESVLRFKFSGQVEIVWKYDPVAILNMVVGQNKSIINDLVNNTFKNSIESIKASIRPQFKQSFPEKSSKIKIIDSIRSTTSSN